MALPHVETQPDDAGQRLERARLWPRVWLCAGRASDADTPGSYFTFELGREVLLVVNDAGELRAFHNVCQHRGHPLRPCGRGTTEALRCPYHGWTYSLGGRLQHVPDRHTFPGGAPADEFSLQPLGCEQRAGFVWVHWGPARESLAEFLGELGPALDDSGIAGWSLVSDATFELATDWKAPLAVEQVELAGPTYALHSQAQRVDHISYRLFPNLTLALGASHAVVYRNRPHASSSQRSLLDVWQLEPGGARSARPMHQLLADGDARSGETLLQLGAGRERVAHTHALLERYLSGGL